MLHTACAGVQHDVVGSLALRRWYYPVSLFLFFFSAVLCILLSRILYLHCCSIRELPDNYVVYAIFRQVITVMLIADA